MTRAEAAALPPAIEAAERSARVSWPRAIGSISQDDLAEAEPAQAPSGPRAWPPGLLDGQLEPLDEPGRPRGARRVAAGQVGQFVRQDRTQLALGQHPQERQAEDQGLRSAPGHHAAAGQIRQPDLPRRPDPEPSRHRVDGREEQRGVDAREHRAEVGVGVARLARNQTPPSVSTTSPQHVDLVAEPAPRTGTNPPSSEQEHRPAVTDQ